MKRSIVNKRVASYKRNHAGTDFGEIESCKVERDKTRAAKARKTTEQALPGASAGVTDEDMEAYGDALHAEKKACGNFKSHQLRYKSLSGHEDFQ